MTLDRPYIREILRVALLGIMAFLCYRWLAGDIFRSQSIAPHFVGLADSFLHGATTLPNEGYDLILYEGAWYVAQPPLPALFLLPFVAIFGAGFSDILFSVGLGTLGVVGCYWALHHVEGLTRRRRLLLTLAFGLGSAYTPLVPMGTVWFLGQVAAVVAMWGYIIALQRGWTWAAGVCLGMLALSRPFVVLGALVYGIGWLMRPTTDDAPAKPQLPATWRDRLMPLLPLAIPLMVACLFLAGYNWTRFGSPLEFGYGYLQDAPNIREKRLEHGIFSPYFLPENLYTATIKPITIRPNCAFAADCGFFEADLAGAGLLWTSPYLLYMFWARGRTARETYHQYLLAVVSVLCLLPPLFYHNTGSAQFGFRFVLDALPFLLMLTAYGARRGKLWWLAGIVFVAVVINLWGARWFIRSIYGV